MPGLFPAGHLFCSHLSIDPQDAFSAMDGTMVANSPTSLVGNPPTIWLPRQQPARNGRVCPICDSTEIFDVTGQLNLVDPAASRVLACKCGAILTLFPPRLRKAK
jgi:hypothetical protein